MQVVRPSRWMGRRRGWMGGYDAFIEKKSANVSCVSFLFCFIFCAFTNSLAFSSSLLRRKSLQMTKSLTHLMGGYLPNTITEMWEPSRDCIFPTSDGWCDERCGAFWVGFLLPFVFVLFFFPFQGFSFFRGFFFRAVNVYAVCWLRYAIHLHLLCLLHFCLLYARRLIETQTHQQDDAARYGAYF